MFLIIECARGTVVVDSGKRVWPVVVISRRL